MTDARRTTPCTVYAITDAAPPRTPPTVPVARYTRLLRRAVVAVAVLLLAGLLLGGAFSTWRWLVVPMLLVWVAWPWLRPVLSQVWTVVLLVLGALDALVTAYVGVPRLAYITRRIAGIIRQTAREEEP
ncbi:hypothetical protein ABGB18_12075 [Nonomuraea sp. B12E4]|uniref:hypothetical protein n=1 Tax=Nonomuraea sp. B12E4 TaxID=3153564 RepID=UPI00325CF4A3